jgi:hypothetical protein
MYLADKIDISDADEKKNVGKIPLKVRKKQSDVLNKNHSKQ